MGLLTKAVGRAARQHCLHRKVCCQLANHGAGIFNELFVGMARKTRLHVLALALYLCCAAWAFAVVPAAFARRRGPKRLITSPELARPAAKFAIRGAEYGSFDDRCPNVTEYVAAGDRGPRGVPPFQPMASPPSGAANGLPFLFIHQPKSAGTSVRQVG